MSASPKVETGDTPTVIRARLTALRRERLPDVVAIACSAGPERVVATTMARSSMRHRAVFKFAAPILAVAILGLCSLPRTDAFTVPSLPGLSSFTGSAAPVNTVGSAKLQTLADQRSRLQARDGASGMAMKAVRNPQLIGTQIPRQWTEGTDFIRDGRNIGTGDLVIISRSDGRCGIVVPSFDYLPVFHSPRLLHESPVTWCFVPASSHTLCTLPTLATHTMVIYVSSPVQ